MCWLLYKDCDSEYLTWIPLADWRLARPSAPPRRMDWILRGKTPRQVVHPQAPGNSTAFVCVVWKDRPPANESRVGSTQDGNAACSRFGNLTSVNQKLLRLITICSHSSKFPGFLR